MMINMHKFDKHTYSFLTSIPALFVLVLNMSMFFVAHLADLGITQLSETLQVMLTSGVIISLFASVVFYIKGSFVKQWKLNPAGNSGILDLI